MSEHYYTSDPEGEIHEGEYTLDLDGRIVTITTSSGVFGKRRLDPGSHLLIETADARKEESVLDLGCGTGVVGICVAIRSGCTMTFSDSNARAVELARRNAQRNGVKGRFVHSDGFSKLDTYDRILLNPPQSAGKEVCLRLIRDAYSHLNPGGVFHMVARHRKGGKSLMDEVISVFGSCDTVKIKSGYRIYRGVRER